MLCVNLAIILIYGMLALLSRKHFSKYKGRRSFAGIIRQWFLAMGDLVCEKLMDIFPHRQTEQRLRKVEVVPPKRLNNLTREYMVKNAAVCMGIFFVWNVLSGIVCIAENMNSQRSNVIEREDYAGDTRKHDIYLNVDGEDYVYSLEVAPVEYTQEQFMTQADRIFDVLDTDILGENEDAEHIYYDLKLPVWDENKVIRIRWSSDRPDCISSYGKLEEEREDKDMKVVLTAELSYHEFSTRRQYPVIVRATKGNIENSVLDVAGQSLDDMESEDRSSRSIVLPEEICGMKVSLDPDSHKRSVWILLLGMAVASVFLLLMNSRLKDRVKNRDNMLMMQYPSFVTRLSLLLQTGMTLKNSLEHMAYDVDKPNLLEQELSYALHEIETGSDEAAVYETLGNRLGLPQYIRLMNHISQNLRLGTRDIRKIMEEEVMFSMESRLENARKKGEEAATKLIFPMVILLAVVMIILIIPAVAGF
ncbi:MAG: immunoglobulin-like domain-containing protein [Wujia sp.]